MSVIQVGIIGMGFIGKLQLDALLRLPSVRIVAVSSTNKDVRNQMKEQYTIKIYADWHDLVADPDVQAVHNCTPTALHLQVNTEVICSGKHLYAEKPLAMNAEEAKQMCSLLALHPVANAINHQYRSNAAVQAMKEALKDPANGQILFIRAHYLQESQCRQDDYSARRMPEDSPARALSDIGSHAIELIHYLTDSTMESVCASMYTHYSNRFDVQSGRTIPMASDDTTSVQFCTTEGVAGVFIASKVAHGHKNDLEISISCSNAEYSWRQEEPDRYIRNCRETGNTTIYMSPALASAKVKPYISLPSGHVMGWADALKNNMDRFYDAIGNNTYRNEQQAYTTFSDGLAIQCVIDACIASSKAKAWVRVQGEGR
ncbi:MAG: Gfo/Idh/MocA family oxidoreductase [Spirochaetia bacterium]|nr:Gfo/Idh/MocA family oxidoreductase [Spirochaetia bacterium]